MTTAVAMPAARRSAAMRLRLAALVSPANSSGWTSSRATEGAGRSAQTASTGLAATGTSVAPLVASAAAVAATQPRVWSQGS